MPKRMKLAKDAQKNEMGQGNLKEMKWAKEAQNSMSVPNDNAGLLELSKEKAYSRPKRGSASTSQIIAWQEQQDGMAKVLTNLQKRVRNGLEKKRPTTKQDPTQERSKT